jgi:hypothetical protein
MKSAYRILAYLVAIEVVLQSALIAFALFGLARWIEDGGVLDKAGMESGTVEFTGVIGFPFHALNGLMVVPVLALLLLVVSFFAKVPRGVLLAGLTVLFVAVQVLLGMFARGVVELGALHGANALALFVTAVLAARAARSVPAARHTAATPADRAGVAGA